jgi:hypothetical protein
LPPSCLHVPTVLKSGSLNLLEPSGPVQASNRIAGNDCLMVIVTPVDVSRSCIVQYPLSRCYERRRCVSERERALASSSGFWYLILPATRYFEVLPQNFEKLLLALSCLPVCPSVHMDCSAPTERIFIEIRHSRIYRKLVEKVQVGSKSGKSNGYFT